MADTPALQVFIIGPARSGTSSLFWALHHVFALPGHGESHLMPLIQRSIFFSRRYHELFLGNAQDILLHRFPIDDFETQIFAFVQSFYQAAYRGNQWIDKTPSSEAIHGIPLIKVIFPQAKLICTKRNGIETVVSRQQKFDEPFAASCREWAAAMEGVRLYAAPDPAVLLVDQSDLRSNPEQIAARISAHLEDSTRHEALAAFLAKNQFEVSGATPRALTLKETGWPREDVKAFVDICGPAMAGNLYEM